MTEKTWRDVELTRLAEQAVAAGTIPGVAVIVAEGDRIVASASAGFADHASDGRVGHFGGGMGYWNLLRLCPETARAAAVMSNTTTHWDITTFADTAIDISCRPVR